MGRVQRAFCVLIIASGNVGIVNGTVPIERVCSAIDRQDAWLAESSDGVVWQSYLQTSQLREALASPTVDRRLLASLLGRYNSNAPGLSEGPFVSTRNALSDLANQAQVPMSLRWAEQLRASSQFEAPFSPEALRDAKYDLVDAKNSLDQFLGQADYDTQNAWKVFLKWNDLEEQLQAESPDWKVVDTVTLKYRDGYPGLEYPAFVRVREALQKFGYIGKLRESGEAKANINQYSNALADALEKYNAEPSTKQAANVAALLDWLNTIDRDQGLATQLRATHNLPNVKLIVSERFLSKRFARPVNDSTYVNEMILKTHVCGTATTNGKITADVVPNQDGARVDIVFNGVTQTVSVGRQKPVTIRSTSATTLQARKSLFLHPNRIEAAPATGSGFTNTHINSITPDNQLGRRLVQKIAWKRAGEQKPQAERISADRAARRLEGKLDVQSQELLNQARASLQEQLNGPLKQRGLIPESMHSHSLDQCVIVDATQADAGQLSTTTYPPTFFPNGDVVAQVHESAVNNTAEKAIAGLTLTDERIADLTKEMTGEVPEELQIGEDDQPWSISFDWNQPITVEFDNQTMKIAVRGRRFTSGERTLRKTMEMSATYSMETLPQGVVLTRQGDIEVTFPGNRDGVQLRAADRIFKTLMEQKFGELFKPVIEGNGFTLPGRFQELGVIRLNELSADDGWLSLGWK